MTIADPKKYAKRDADEDALDLDTAASLMAQVAELQATVQALIASQTQGGSLSDDRLESILLRVAQMSADAQERAANPSNKTHPGISVFSYPEGDRARPRPDLARPMFWVGYPIDKDTTTAEELSLLARAEPGIYPFTRTDGNPERLTIRGDRGPDGALTRLLFEFPTQENRETLPSMVSILRQAFKVKTPEQIELETLRAQVAAMGQAVAV